MKRCDYCGHVAEYDGQPHGIEDCAEHLRLENEQLRQALGRLTAAASDWVAHPAHLSPLGATIMRIAELNAAIAEATALGAAEE